MKRRGVGLCPASSAAEGALSSSPQKKAANNPVLGRCVYHQLQAGGKAFRRGLPINHNYHRLLSLYGITSPPDASPLDLSTKSSRPGPSSVSKLQKSSSDKELTWKPLRKPLAASQGPGCKKWFPVVRKPANGNKTNFFPLSKEGKNNLRYRWMNPLNRIFLQEKNVAAEGHQSEGKKETPPPPTIRIAHDDTPTNQGSSPSKSEKVGPLPTMKPTATNPFKITPSNSWPLEHNEHPSKPILAPPKFGANSGFGKLGCVGSISQPKETKPLAPPILLVSSSETAKPMFKLKPPVLGGTVSTAPISFKRPVSKLDSPSSPGCSDDVEYPDFKRARTSHPSEEASSDSHESSPSDNEKHNIKSEDSPVHTQPSSSISCTSSVKEVTSVVPVSPISSSTSVPTFVPLSNNSPKEANGSEESTTRVNGVGGTTSPLSSKVGNAGFIFGQNLENRVSGVSSSSSAAIRFSNGETNSSSASSGLNLFTAAANSIATQSATGEGAKSLSESSREFSLKEESLKTKYEEVQTVTGEEGEKNVIQMNCKLYGWSNGAWQERGRGILRLNDREIRDELHSRLVVRTQGTLTVMLNATIWAEMSIEKPNDKSVRFTASDVDGQPKIYLVMGSPKDITLLHNSLEYRVAAARSQILDEKERDSDQEPDALPHLSI